MRCCRHRNSADHAVDGPRGGKARLWTVLGLGAMALLAGCGFHLQGAVELPQANRRIFISTGDLLTPFAVELRRAIERAGGTIAPSAGAAGTVLRIAGDRAGRRVLSVSVRNTPQEYEVYYAVEYSVDRAGREVLETQRLELTRNMSFDATKVLAKDQEEAVLREAIARDLAALALRRLSSIE